MSRLPSLVALLLGCALLLAACGGSGKEKAASTPTPTASPSAAPSAPAACQKVPAPKPKAVKVPKPTERLQKGKTYVARVLTNCGEFDITLDPAHSPRTGGSFKTLADKHFYDGLSFHRIVAGFVIQGGDPKGDGSGGPGWTIAEAPPRDLTYGKGVVAMAKTETEPAGTSGSQFFVVTAPDAQLPPDYGVLGKVVSGQGVVAKIGKLGDPASGGEGTPTETVEIEKATLTVH